MRKLFLGISIILIFTLMGACSDSEKVSSSKSESKKSEVVRKGKLNEDDYDKLYSNPKKYKGYEVELTGQIFTEPEKDDDGTYIQIWADPENSEKNTIVGIKDSSLKLKTDDYVKVKGIVKDKFKGENALGGTVEAPVILASSIEVVDYITAISPTIKEINVNKEINQHDIIVTLQKIEIAKNQTRVFIKVNNKTKDKASFYSSSVKLVVNNKQLEEDYIGSSTTGLQEVQSELLPGVESEGVVIFPAIDVNEKSLKVHSEGSSDNYELDFEPYVFDVPVN